MPENPRHNARKNGSGLYPPIEPFEQYLLDMPGGHRVYVEECGNPNGRPVIVLHGGPGGGCSPGMRRFFDPSHYRVVLFDQRGCGRSIPNASVNDNDTWILIEDIERIRKKLGISDFAVFGGSWGATLALAYAQAHPERVNHLILRGVFMAMQSELDWFYGGGAGHFWPQDWARFCEPIPPEERDDMIAAYGRRLFGEDEAAQVYYARIWAGWESALASAKGHARNLPSGSYARAFARLENHYFQHKAFMKYDGQLLAEADKIAHIPGIIVQGRLDMICPPVTAHKLNLAWPRSKLEMIEGDGHALSEPGITACLLKYMDGLRP
jgi:proline iminopeptidase